MSGDLTVIVCGSRDLMSDHHMVRVLGDLLVKHRRMTVVHGAAGGADRLAGAWAKANKVPCFAVPAQWHIYERAAGPKRNAEMLATYRPQLVLAFYSQATRSKGTLDMVNRARAAGVRALEFFPGEELPR